MEKIILSIIFIIALLLTSCKKDNSTRKNEYVSNEIVNIIDIYSKENKLRLKTGKDSLYVSKQSYELSFYRIGQDTVMYIGRIPFYSNDIFLYANNSSLYKELGFKNNDFMKNPTYMGTFFYKDYPIHIYDIRDKVGRKEYNFNNLISEDFKDYYITDPFIGDTMASFWVYKIKNGKFELYKETYPFKYM